MQPQVVLSIYRVHAIIRARNKQERKMIIMMFAAMMYLYLLALLLLYVSQRLIWRGKQMTSGHYYGLFGPV